MAILRRLFYHHRGMGDAAGQVYKRLANLLTEKLDLCYREVMGWIRCKLALLWLGQQLCASVVLVHGYTLQYLTLH